MKKGKKENWSLIGLLLAIILLWGLSWLAVDKMYCSIQSRGAFGDKFGFANSLFSGLALGGIIYSLILQRKETKEAREEFIDQNFQTIFFNLLQTQRQIADNINAEIRYLASYSREQTFFVTGRQFFIESKNQLEKILTALNSPVYSEYHAFDPDIYPEPSSEEEDTTLYNSMSIAFTISFYNIKKTEWENSKTLEPLCQAELAYAIFFGKYNYVIGHYFRHLYHIYNFIDSAVDIDTDMNKAKFAKFSEFVQAQMAIPELFLLFYNSLSFPKLQSLLKRYNVLENLPLESLLDKSHNAIDGITLKSDMQMRKF